MGTVESRPVKRVFRDAVILRRMTLGYPFVDMFTMKPTAEDRAAHHFRLAVVNAGRL